jgi:signal peptidase II
MRTDAFWFFGIIVADRITKVLVPRLMDIHQSIPVIPGFFQFTFVKNTGGAFGILAGWDSPLRRGFFIIASLGALFLLYFLYRQMVRDGSKSMRVSLVFIAAGALGNLYDRFTTGEVVDFLDIFIGRHHWPAFNLADSAISIGAVLLIYLYLTGRADPPRELPRQNAP